MKIEIRTNKGELGSFLRYFYYVEGIAQGTGEATGEKWESWKAWRFHDRLMELARKLEKKEKCDGECNCPDCKIEPPKKRRLSMHHKDELIEDAPEPPDKA